MQRREFLRRTAVLGATALAGASLVPSLLAESSLAPSASPTKPTPATGPAQPEIAVVESADRFAATLRAVELVGGMSRFVPRGAKVGLLLNASPYWRNPGTFTSPDVSLAVLHMLVEAGASDITLIVEPSAAYWGRTALGAKYPQLIAAAHKSAGEWLDVDVPRGVVLKKARINRVLLDCEVLINVPITKHHAGAGYTGCLKNMMGCSHRSTNKSFHSAGGDKDGGDDIDYLSQCIADLNTLRRPALNICDSTEFLTTNGPGGPGETRRADKILAGADAVAVDAYGCTLLGLSANKTAMIGKAAAHGLGQPDLAKITIHTAKI